MQMRRLRGGGGEWRWGKGIDRYQDADCLSDRMRRRLKSPASRTGRCSSSLLARSMPISWLSTAAKKLISGRLDVKFRWEKKKVVCRLIFPKISLKTWVQVSLRVATLLIRLGDALQVEIHCNQVVNNRMNKKFNVRSGKSLADYRSEVEHFRPTFHSKIV